jgi:hypothetical protein
VLPGSEKEKEQEEEKPRMLEGGVRGQQGVYSLCDIATI